MEGIVRLGGKEAVGRHHQRHRGGLHGKAGIVEAVFFQQAQVAEGGFHQGLRGGVAVFFKQDLFQGAAVDADADRNVVGLAAVHHGLDPVLSADVAGVDADGRGSVFRSGQRAAVVKVDVRNDGQRGLRCNFSERNRRLRGGDGDAGDLTAGRGEGLDLRDGALHVRGPGVAHGLDGNRRAAAHKDGADFDLSGHVFVLHFGVACGGTGRSGETIARRWLRRP